MKKLLFLLCGLSFFSPMKKAHAQLKDVTFTVAPVAGYTWWNHHLNFNNAPSWGLRAGFGLGKIVELRASYERSINLKSNIPNSGWATISPYTGIAADSKVNLDRFGGDLKVNLWSGTLVSSYLTAGSGVMHFNYKDLRDLRDNAFKDDLIYGTLGLGIKYNITPRIVLSVEGRNLMFKPNEPKPYLKAGVSEHKLLQNWSALASVDFYLGGYNEKKNDDITNAYHDYFSSGFKNIKFVLEPSIGYWYFNDESAFRNQVFEGISAGVDFTPVFGIRGFYYQATKHNLQPDYRFNKHLRMYGGNLIARLNKSRGVTPYLNVGAGYLKVNGEKYEPRVDQGPAQSGWFLMGGAGLEVPFNKYVSLFGSANAMVTRQDNPTDNITSPSSLNIGVFSQAGLRFNFGKSSKSGRSAHEKAVDAAVEAQREVDLKDLNALRASYKERTEELNAIKLDYDLRTQELNNLKADFNQRIADLNAQLTAAVTKRDTVEVTKLVIKKQKMDEACQRIDSIQDAMETAEIDHLIQQSGAATTPQAKAVHKNTAHKDTAHNAKMIRLTKAEYTQMIQDVVKAAQQADDTEKSAKTSGDKATSLSDLDRLLLINILGRSAHLPQNQEVPLPTTRSLQPQQAAPTAPAENNKENSEILNKLNQVVDKLDNHLSQQRNEVRWANNLAQNNANVQAAVAAAFRNAPVMPQAVTPMPVAGTTATTPNMASSQSARTSFLKLNRLSVFTGANFGTIWNTNIGIRSNMQVSNTNLDFMPEFYVGLGSHNGFGISTNIVYNFDYKSWPVLPYAGLGLGVFKAKRTTRFGPNIIVGASLRSNATGSFFLDYSSRNLFKNHQLAIGYRFIF